MLPLDILIRADGIPVVINGDAEAYNHFNNPNSYAKFIVQQMNRDDIYGRYLSKRSGLTILDIGANIGLFSIYASSSASRIVSIEPTPAHLSVMRTITRNIPNITIVESALNNEDKPVPFFLTSNNTTMNSYYNHHDSKTIIQVEGKRLKTIMDDNNLDKVDFCKIDIEGSEMTAITDDTISEVKDRISVIFIEVHNTSMPLRHNVEQISSIFRKNGYLVEFSGADTIVACRIPF